MNNWSVVTSVYTVSLKALPITLFYLLSPEMVQSQWRYKQWPRKGLHNLKEWSTHPFESNIPALTQEHSYTHMNTHTQKRTRTDKKEIIWTLYFQKKNHCSEEDRLIEERPQITYPRLSQTLNLWNPEWINKSFTCDKCNQLFLWDVSTIANYCFIYNLPEQEFGIKYRPQPLSPLTEAIKFCRKNI